MLLPYMYALPVTSVFTFFVVVLCFPISCFTLTIIFYGTSLPS